MTLKTTEERREQLLQINQRWAVFNNADYVLVGDLRDLCHDADMAAGMEKKNAALQAKLDEAWAWLGEVFPKIQTSSQWIDYHTITGEQASRLIALRTPKEQEK